MISEWPEVLSEDRTLQAVINGASLARFGDGEFNLALGRHCITQSYNAEIRDILRKILHEPASSCLVGIPRVNMGPKKEFWNHFDRPDVINLLGQEKYHSAFISRPDSAPWIDTPNYWDKVESLWLNKSIILVRGSIKSLTAAMLKGADVKEVIVPHKDAFAYRKKIIEKVNGVRMVLLCCGPTATVLAHDLSQMGIQAIDLGHIGMFLDKHRRGKPMLVTAKDKAFDRA